MLDLSILVGNFTYLRYSRVVMKVKGKRTVTGDYYTFTWQGKDSEGTEFTQETTLKFTSWSPFLVFGQSLTRIDDPLRFGPYGTRSERVAYCERLAKGDW